MDGQLLHLQIEGRASQRGYAAACHSSLPASDPEKEKENMAARAGAFLMVVCLVLATAAAVSGARPIAMPEEGGAARATVESPAGDAIQTMVRAVERRFMFDVGMLRGIKNSGPSPGDGH
ncbi:hypothetical protein ZWY2020_002179 [Hordeum vulgare]|nr:hypothetical protein ZWY2020_002179 [Hordeum vulgare]